MSKPSGKGTKKARRGVLSTIDLLPEDLRVELNAALRDRRLTQKEIVVQFNILLKERGGKRLSYSAVNRYASYIEEQSLQLRQSQEASNAIIGGLNNQPEGDLGRAINQIIKSLTFETMSRLGQEALETGEPVDLGKLKELALLSQRLERAAKTGQERELRLRELFRKECSDKLEDAVKSGDLQATAA